MHEGIQEFLHSMDLGPLNRGRNYLDHGRVLELECVEPDHIYFATVRGEQDYEVELEFTDAKWTAECSCPVGLDCKHIAAALLALRQGVRPSRTMSVWARKRIAAAAKRRWERMRNGDFGTRRTVEQPPPSRLRSKLAAHLGRELRPPEASFVRRVQSFFATSERLTEGDLRTMAREQGFSSSASWEVLDLWPAFPSDDFQLWLFVAWELRKREWWYPRFMEGITDLGLIEGVMKEWNRQKEIANWKGRFQQFENDVAVSEPGVLDLRLVLFASEARLEWRSDQVAPFAELKPPQARKFVQQFENNALIVTPDSLPLWTTVLRSWPYDNRCTFRYTNIAACAVLNRLLRMPLALDRVVTAEGRSLPRHDAPLRLNLRTPENHDGDYEVSLVTANSSPAPPVLCALSGHPTLYLTEQGLFSGPPADLVAIALSSKIPAPALESDDGVQFLHAAGVPLPEPLAQRVRTVPVAVTISCRLKPSHPGSRNEDVLITVEANAPGMKSESFSANGWPHRHEAKKPCALNNGFLTVYDRTAQRRFPRVLE
jgi:hypothetical protein